MKCVLCGKKFSDGAQLVAVLSYVTNEKRGDAVPSSPSGYIHLFHLKDLFKEKK